MLTARRGVAALALFLILATAGCGDAALPLEPAPSDLPPSMVVERIPGTLKKRLLDGEVATALIGFTGGRLSVAGVRVDVPAGAVLLPTQFTISLEPVAAPGGGHYLEANLTAIQNHPILGLIDIGELGFAKRIKLTFSYRDMDVDDPSRLRVARLLPGNTLEVLRTNVHPGKRSITARTTHFSRYCMVSD